MPAKRRPISSLTGDPPLDVTNLRLLAELQADARISLAELGRRVGLSSPAVAERIQRLEEAGCITGYRADVEPRALGYGLGAVVRIRPAARQIERVAELARTSAEVVECHRITGDDCFILKAHVRDVAHLEQLIDRFTPYGQTTTSIIQSTPVPPRGPALPEYVPRGRGPRLNTRSTGSQRAPRPR